MDPVRCNLAATFPGRKSQIAQLYNLFHSDECLPDCVYVHGGPSTGKTAIIQELLKVSNIPHATVNLVECYTTKILLESILNRLTAHQLDLNNIRPHAKCDNVADFVLNLKKCVADRPHLRRSVIVLDKAERVRDMEFNLLPCFLRLKELTGLNVSVIMISEIAFQKFFMKCNAVEPIKVHFNQYTKEEVADILAEEFARNACHKEIVARLDIDADFYRNYLNVFLSVFYRVCRDLCELRYMARINFAKYCEPVLRGQCAVTDGMALWRHIAPILKSSLEILYLRLSATKNTPFSKENLAQSLELPFYAKYLIITAYLASYNPAKDDKRLFMKCHGKKKGKTMRDVMAKSKVSEQLSTQLGPKAFTFDRLLAIFYAILDDKVGFNNNLLVQVSSLVELQLLSAISDNCNLDGQRYKCNVGYDFVQTIAKMVGFNLRKYLSDFSHI